MIRFAVIAVLSLAVTACQEPRSGPASTNLSISIAEMDANYTAGEPIGLTVHIAEKDQRLHGLPESGHAVATGSFTAYADLEMSQWIGVDRDQQVFECFDPIEIRDERSEVVLSIPDFCPTSPQLKIRGDIRAGTEVEWEFRSGKGNEIISLNDQ